MYLTPKRTKMIQILSERVPVWICLLTCICAYMLASLRDQPNVVTRIEYKDRWELPAPKLRANPSIITLYKTVPVDKIDTVTVYVPTGFGRFDLFSEDRVSTSGNSVTLQVFDTQDLRFRELTYITAARSFDITAELSTEYHYFSSELHVRAGLRARYKDLSAAVMAATYAPMIFELRYSKTF